MTCYETDKDIVLQEDLNSIAKFCESSIDELKNTTVFITGASGLVGSQIVKSLLCMNRLYNAGIKVVANVLEERFAEQAFGSLLPRDDVELYIADVTKPFKFEGKVDYIFHTASVTASKFFVTNPVETLDISILGTKNALEFAREKKIKGMIYLSSMEAYGVTDPSLERVTEKDLGYIDILNVRSSYSEGKRICECLCAAYASEYEVPVKIARLAQTFGAGVSMADNRAFAQFAKSSLKNEDIVLHTAGTSYGNYCYTADVVRGLFTILLKGEKGEAYTVANETTSMQIKDVAALVAGTLSDGTTKVVFDIPESALTYGYAPDVTIRLSAAKLRNLGWEPVYNLKEMFERLAKSWQATGEAN